MEGGNFVQIR